MTFSGKMTFGGRRPLVEDDFGRRPSVEDNLWWKTAFGGRQPFGGRWPSVVDTLLWKTIHACFLVPFAAFLITQCQLSPKKMTSIRKYRIKKMELLHFFPLVSFVFKVHMFYIDLVCLRFGWDMHEICLRNDWEMLEICLRFVWDLSEIRLI